MVGKALSRVCIGLLLVVCSLILLCNWSVTGLKTLSVPTGSMTPAIPKNSLVLVKSVPATSLKVGDVITYINPYNLQQTISHRIVKTYTIAGKVPAFVTKGDANKVPDVPVTSGSVVGKVVWHIPYAGKGLLWSKGWVGLAVLVYVPALLLMIEEIQRLAVYYKLAIPYRLYGFSRRRKKSGPSPKYAVTGALSIVFVLVGALFWQPAWALLQSSPVSLANNHLAVAAATGHCSGNTTNNTNVTVNNSSSQTSTSGSTSSSGNTTGGTATSGNTSNSNSTSTTVTITNGC